MRIVIFGASGMLGQELVREFSDYDALAPSPAEVDLNDDLGVREYLFRTRPAFIINAAAYNFVDQAEEPAGYVKAMALNAQAVRRLAHVAELMAAPFIHYSTDQVFAREEPAGFYEDDPPGPAERLSCYGRSKLLGEKLLKQSTRRFYLVRTSRLFGRPAEDFAGKRSVVDVFLELAKANLFVKAVNEEVASPTFARDLARATRELWDDRAPWGTYHLTNDGAATWYQIAKAVVALSGQGAIVRPVGAEAFGRLAFRPRFSLLLNTKRPKLRPWQEALAEYLKQSKKLENRRFSSGSLEPEARGRW